MRILKITLIILTGIAVGIGIAIYKIADVDNSTVLFKNGSWLGSKDLPLGRDNLLTAQATVFAMFALPSDEAVYLFSKRGSNGNLLHSSKDYEIRGNVHDIHARYWSITMYGKDLYLVRGGMGHYSYNNTSLQTDSLGNFTISVSHTPHPGNWLAPPDNDRFYLVFRMYMADPAFVSVLDKTPLPKIITLPAK